MTIPRILVTKGGSQFERYPLPFSRFAPLIYADHYAPRAAACRRYHIDILKKLPPTICDPVVPLLVAFYDPR
jgi:hypothetical protein